MSLTQYGVMAGLTVYAVPQVLAATLPIGALSNQVGTIVKLVRVLMLGPVVLLMSLLASKLRDETNEPASELTAGVGPKPGKPALHKLVPWFIVGFLVVVVVRTAGLIPAPVLHPTAVVANLLTTISMASLGLGRHSGRGKSRATADGSRHAVAPRPRIDQFRDHPSHRRGVKQPE